MKEEKDMLLEKTATPYSEVFENQEENNPHNKKVFIETFGCQMNVSDSEIVASLLKKKGYDITFQAKEADFIFINTCSIREKAEQTVRNRLKHYIALRRKKNTATHIGVLGCMAERMKSKLFDEEQVDIIAGPDSYRSLPHLIEQAQTGQKAVEVFLSREETYADIAPWKLSTNKVTTLLSIMRGCDNMCTFCVVPFTRGRERSRDPHSILREAKSIYQKGYKEITLLGQNVDSYLWSEDQNLKGKLQIQKSQTKKTVNFAQLMEQIAEIDPQLRIRFSTSHPRDITLEVLHTMKKYPNICSSIHLPIQSGSSRVLALMNRGYTQEMYKEKVEQIWDVLEGKCSISTDIITGFCTETEEDHHETLKMMEWVKYNFSYMFTYSQRPNTVAAKKFQDNVPTEVKKKRLQEIIALQNTLSKQSNETDVGKTFQVLIEGFSKRSTNFLQGRNSQNKVIVFPKQNFKIGEYAQIKVKKFTSATLIGESI